MKSEIKEQWLKDLRSGNYRQAKNQLKEVGFKGSRPSYCCLGILCNIYNKQTGQGSWDKNGVLVSEVYCNEDGSDLTENGVLPNEVRRWAGLNKENPHVQYGGKYHAISELNDGKARVGSRTLDYLNFKQIADLIEVQLPG